MSELTIANKKKLVLVAGRSHPELAAEVAANLGIDLLPTDAYDFCRTRSR